MSLKKIKNIMPGEAVSGFHHHLHHWYRVQHRKLPWRETSDPYAVWVSEVMLQQTQVKTVLKYYLDFMRQFPDVRRLAEADLQEVLKSWELMGYYARARNLHRAAQIVLQEYDGVIPRECSRFAELPGVGEYIAAAVCSIAYQEPRPVLDGNVRRVLSRLFSITVPVNVTQSNREFRAAVHYIFNERDPGTYNQAMMELGALICAPLRPRCADCPVNEFCSAFRTGRQTEFPRRKAKPKIPVYHIAVGIVMKENQLLITRRPETGLLGGLWEFPGGKIRENETALEACRREIREELNIGVEVLEPLIRVKHAYTHFRIRLEVFLCRYVSGKIRLNGPVDFRWIYPGQLEEFPFPAANHRIFPALRQKLEQKGVKLGW